MLLHLPKAFETALTEQLACDPHISISAVDDTTEADLIVHKISSDGKNMPQALRPGVPAFALSFERRKRLGSIIRHIRQMLKEPALYLDPFNIGPYRFIPAEKRLEDEKGNEIELTDRETDILAYLARNAGNSVDRDTLLKNLWRYQANVETHTLETHIYRLRQKIEKNADTPDILITSGQGYYLNMKDHLS